MPQTDPSDADNQPEGDARPDAPSNSSARASGNGWVRWLKRLAILCFVGVLTGFGFVWYTNHVARRAGEGILFDDVDAVPEGRVGLVFGCSKKIGGRDNRYFKYRIEAAAELFQAGKVNVLIVSGDNRKLNYNEPIDMKNALIAKGIPSDRIVCDYAGLRT
ncbi:MAG: SanA/YdcF family protein, partial [Akkermansiaceae bacterium]